MDNEMKKNREFIFVCENSIISTTIKNLESDERVTLVRRKTVTYFLFRGIRKILLHFHADWLASLVDSILFRIPVGCGLRDINWHKEKEYYIIFYNPTLYPKSPRYLNILQKKYKVYSVLFIWDTLTPKVFGRLERLMIQSIKNYISSVDFKYIFTMDQENARQFGWIYHDIPYSPLLTAEGKRAIEFDLCLTCSANGREEELYNVFKEIKRNEIKSRFRMVGVSKDNQRYNNEIMTTPIPYSVLIEEEERSNCILEVMHPGQIGATSRYYEAICYNKKLLTNNKNVVNLPFYNPDYIHVFEKPEDIDWEWVKERIPVDYHYDGRFSPTHLIDKIIELEEEREKKENGEKEDN